MDGAGLEHMEFQGDLDFVKLSLVGSLEIEDVAFCLRHADADIKRVDLEKGRTQKNR